MHSSVSSSRRVVITGVGAVTPVGLSAAETWRNLLAGQSGIGPITRFDTTECPVKIAGEVKNFDPLRPLATPLQPRGAAGEALAAVFSAKDVKKFGRFAQLGCVAGVEAYADSGLDAHRATIAPERIGVNFGVGFGGLPEIEAMHATWQREGFRRISPFFIIQIASNLLAGQMSLLLDLRGPNMSVASACATSGHALGEAAAAIARGDADVMIAGGAESTVTPLAIGAFAQMRALSKRNEDPAKASRPYEANRDGFVLAEGAVAFVLEDYEHARRRGARIIAELRGYGATADAHHLSSLAPEAEGSQRAMRLAMKQGGLAAADIDYVSAHATSTPGGDGEEAAAIAAVFGERRSEINVSAVKSMTGHLLGGAGALGALTAVLAIRDGVVSPTINLDEVDPACAATGINFTPHHAVKRPVRAALANSFGFGGTNACLAFSSPPPA